MNSCGYLLAKSIYVIKLVTIVLMGTQSESDLILSL